MDRDEVEEFVAAVENVATQLKWLGTGDAATSMGAVELLSMEVKNGAERIASAIDNLADAVREHAERSGD